MTESDAYEVEDDDEVRSMEFDSLGLEPAEWLAWTLPVSTGHAGHPPIPDPTSHAPLHLRC